MFTKGQIVRFKGEGDGTSTIMQVVEDSQSFTGTTEVSTWDGPNTDGYTVDATGLSSYDTNDLELVAESLQEHEDSDPMNLNAPARTQEAIHDDIAKMFIQVAQYVTTNADESTEIRIRADYSSGDSMDIAFEVRVRYGDWVNSSDLFKSAEVAVKRHTEDKGLKALSIPMFK